MNHRGRIIAIEGVDAVGKHTQSLLLETWFRNHGIKSTSLSFPDYGTPIGKEIKAFLAGRRDFPAEVRHMLFAANRWEKSSLIRKSQAECEVVIVNRYTESNLVYGVANGLHLDWLASLEEGLPKSNLVMVLEDPSKGLVSRRPGRKDSYEKDQELQVRVQTLYKELAPKFGWMIIDGSRSVRSVHNSIVEAVRANIDARPRARP
ncbi:MAG: dTMP kinase [Nitrososphaerales archaeon]